MDRKDPVVVECVGNETEDVTGVYIESSDMDSNRNNADDVPARLRRSIRLGTFLRFRFSATVSHSQVHLTIRARV